MQNDLRSRGAARARHAFVLVIACAGAVATPAYAQHKLPEAAARSAARDLGNQGIAAYDAGNYDVARDRFRRAYELLPAPTLALREARALVKLGRLVEALEAYTRAERTTLGADANDVFREAVRDAGRERPQVQARLARLALVTAPANATGFEIRVDGIALPSALIGVERPVDPGAHRIELLAPGRAPSVREITLKEGERREVTLEVPSAPHDVAAVPLPTPASPAASKGATSRTLGWVSLGLGAGGLVVGVVEGLAASSKHVALVDACGPSHTSCPADAAQSLSSFRTARTVSLVGYGVGIVGVGAGAALLLFGNSKDPSSASVSAWVTPGSAGLRGAF